MQKYLEQDPPRVDHTRASRKIGKYAALALSFLAVAYAMVTISGILSLKSQQDPIQDPYVSLMEVLIVVMAPLMVIVMVTVHLYASHAVKAYSLTALAFIIVCAGITTIDNFAMLTVHRQGAFTGVSWLPLVLSWKWPSVVYILDILAWDWFYGLSMLCAAPVFKDGRLETTLRTFMAVSGALSIAGLIFLPFGDISLRMIGILGYAGLSPVVFLLLAIVLGRAESSSEAAARSIGHQLSA